MTFLRSIAFRHRRLVLGTLAFALLLGSAPAVRAAEVAPQLSLQSMLLDISLSPFGESHVDCFVGTQDANGNFTCASGQASGRVVGVTDSLRLVVGHVIRIVWQVSSTTTETYEGSIARTGPGITHPFYWMAGSVKRTTRTRSCTPRNQCVTLTRTIGPLPFTGEAFILEG